MLYGEIEQGVTLVAFLLAKLSERGVFIQSFFQAQVFIASELCARHGVRYWGHKMMKCGPLPEVQRKNKDVAPCLLEPCHSKVCSVDHRHQHHLGAR